MAAALARIPSTPPQLAALAEAFTALEQARAAQLQALEQARRMVEAADAAEAQALERFHAELDAARERAHTPPPGDG